MSTLNITTRALAVTPAANTVTAFLDSGNGNALTFKFSDCTYKSYEAPACDEDSLLRDTVAKQLDKLTCAVAAGVITMADYITFTDGYDLYESITYDTAGNIVSHSIGSTSPTTPAPTGSFNLHSPSLDASGQIAMAETVAVANDLDFIVTADRDGDQGIIDITLFGAPTGVTVSSVSVLSNSSGVVTTTSNAIAVGTSNASVTISYDGAAAIGVYTFVLVGTSTAGVGYLSVELTVTA